MNMTAKRDLALDASMQQVYKAKKKAMQCIDGDGLPQFFKLWDYTLFFEEESWVF